MKEIKLSVITIEKKEVKGKGEIIYIIGRDEQWKKKIVPISGFKPYFYVNSNASIPNDKRIDSIENNFISYLKEPVTKINVVNSFDVGTDEHEGVRHHFSEDDLFECKIPFKTRFKLDMKIKCGIIITIKNQD